MIRSFRHKGLRRFFLSGVRSGIPVEHVQRLARQLRRLDKAMRADDMNMPGWKFHRLRGDRSAQWAIAVSGNWRLVFRFKDGHAYDVDCVDYH